LKYFDFALRQRIANSASAQAEQHSVVAGIDIFATVSKSPISGAISSLFVQVISTSSMREIIRNADNKVLHLANEDVPYMSSNDFLKRKREGLSTSASSLTPRTKKSCTGSEAGSSKNDKPARVAPPKAKNVKKTKVQFITIYNFKRVN
jgi:hypothetical protein